MAKSGMGAINDPNFSRVVSIGSGRTALRIDNKDGLNNIARRHADIFVISGIPANQIQNAVTVAVESGYIVGFQGKHKGRPIVEYILNGITHRMAVTLADNGLIIGANPVLIPKSPNLKLIKCPNA